MIRTLALLICLLGTPGLANTFAPNVSLRPEARPVPAVVVVQAFAPARSMRPLFRPKHTPVMGARRGAGLCGSASIKGERADAVTGRITGCGITSPVRVTEIAGVALSTPALLHCDTANAVEAWVMQSVRPELREIGGGIASLQVAASYQCRTRNNRPGGKISEHGKGRAIDIASFVLRDGSRISVLHDWRKTNARSQALRAIHEAACGPFKTVLGPNADIYHQDHIHMDNSERGGRAYCR